MEQPIGDNGGRGNRIALLSGHRGIVAIALRRAAVGERQHLAVRLRRHDGKSQPGGAGLHHDVLPHQADRRLRAGAHHSAKPLTRAVGGRETWTPRQPTAAGFVGLVLGQERAVKIGLGNQLDRAAVGENLHQATRMTTWLLKCRRPR